MDTFGYGRCGQCDEENFLQEGSKCARCLGLGYLPIDDVDTEEESSNISWIARQRSIPAASVLCSGHLRGFLSVASSMATSAGQDC